MSDATIAGLFLIGVPLAFNSAFALLGARFEYPDILRQPTSDVLARFRAGGTSLVLLWWGFALTAVLQFLGLVRWRGPASRHASLAPTPNPMLCSLEFVGANELRAGRSPSGSRLRLRRVVALARRDRRRPARLAPEPENSTGGRVLRTDATPGRLLAWIR